MEWKVGYQYKVLTTLKNYLKPYFNQQPVNKINKANLLSFRVSLTKTQLKNQKTLSASRVNQIMQPVRMILEEAADRYGFESPYKNIRNLNEVKPSIHPLSLTDVWQFLNTVRGDLKNYYLVRFFTGMRTSEIDGLRWKNVDLATRQLHIKEALVNGVMETTKTPSSVRTIVMSEPVYKAFQHQYSLSGKHSEYVFCDRKGNPLDYRNVNRRVWHPTLRLLDLEPRRAYATRHTAATLWLASGENPEWIARQLGHSNTEMLFRVYSHYVPDLTRRDGSAFEALLEQSTADYKNNN